MSPTTSTRRRPIRPWVEALEDRVTPTAGDLDLTFNGTGKVTASFPEGTVGAADVAIDAQGRIVTVGWTQDGSGNKIAIARFLPEGVPDTSFDGDGKATVAFPSNEFGHRPPSRGHAVAIDPVDGDIVVVGPADDSRGMGVFRLDEQGRLDTFFGNGGLQTFSIGAHGGHAFDVAIDPYQNIFVVGVAKTSFGSQFAVARLNAGGQLTHQATTSYPLGNYLTAYEVALRPTGEVVVAGLNEGEGLAPQIVVAQFTRDLQPDASFGNGGTVAVTLRDAAAGLDPIGDLGLALQDDGKVVVATTVDQSPGDPIGDQDIALLRLFLDGSPDTAFGPLVGLVTRDLSDHSIDEVGDVTVATDGAIYVVGTWNFGWSVARFRPTGALDTNFGPNQSGFVRTGFFQASNLTRANAVALQTDGNLVVAGRANNFLATTGLEFALARYRTNEGERLVLEPQQLVNDVGDQLRVTVRLLVDGQPGPANRRVNFFARRNGVEVFSRAAQTDAEGTAVFVYTNPSAGLDDLEAVVNGTGLRATGHLYWTAPDGFKCVMQVVGGSPRDSDDDPSVDTVRTVGTFAVKAVLLKDGQPIDGVPLSLRGTNRDRPDEVNPIRTFITQSLDLNENGEIDPEEPGGVALLDGYTRSIEAHDEVIAWINSDADPEPNSAEICGSYRIDFVGGKPVVVLHERGENDLFGAPTADNTIRVPLDLDAVVNVRLLRDIGFRGTPPDKYAGNPADDGVDLTWTVESGPHAGRTGTLRTTLGDISFTLPASHSGVDDVIRITGAVQTHLEPDGEGHFVWHVEQFNQTVTVDWVGPSYDLGLAWSGWFEFGNTFATPAGISNAFGAFVTAEDGHGINGVPVVLRHHSGPNGRPGEDLVFATTSTLFIGLPFPNYHDGVAQLRLDLIKEPEPGVDIYQLLVNGIERDRMTVTWLPNRVLNQSDAPQTMVVENAPFGPETFEFTFPKVTRSGRVTVGNLVDSSLPRPPSQYRLITGAGTTTYELSTILAAYQGPIDICLHLPASFPGSVDLIGFFHQENGQWVDRTTSARNVRDGDGKLVEVIICARADSLSPFALFEKIPTLAADTSAAPPPVGRPAAASLARQGKGKKKKLVVRVTFTDGSLREVQALCQKPRFTAIAAALHDLNGDAVFDSIRFTARRGTKKVSRVVLL